MSSFLSHILSRQFEFTMGAVPTTHIANGCPYPIWATCDTDRQHVLDLSSSYDKLQIGGMNNQDIRSAATEAGKIDFSRRID